MAELNATDTPTHAMPLLFGATGFLAKAFSFNASPITLGTWIYVYGLMI